MVHYVYGGPAGTKRELLVDDRLVVVRTKGPVQPPRSLIASREAQSAVRELQPVLSLPHAKVTVYRCPQEAGERARTALKKSPAVRFAGRCLVDPIARQPVLYSENIFVKFKDGWEDAACRTAIKDIHFVVTRALPFATNAYFIRPEKEGLGLATFDVAQHLLGKGYVDACHPELIREVRRRGIADQWHVRDSGNQGVNATGAWLKTRGEGVTIALIDDGVDLEHPEFGPPSRIVAPWDATRGVPDPRPGSGDDHGTACAGVACASGLGRASGIAPAAHLMPIRLVSGLGSMQEAMAFQWAADCGADVISCSWGPIDGEGLVTPLPDSTRLAIEYAVTKGRGGKGCVIFWAAGNGDESADDDGYASCPQVMAVAACNDAGRRSWYSDRGDCVWCCCPSSDGPGNRGIFTTDRRGAAGYNPGREDLGDAAGDCFNGFGGTSSATPLAAGIAALVLSRNPDLTWTQVRELLKATAEPIDKAGGKYDPLTGHSALYGYGRLDARAAVDKAVPPNPAFSVTHAVRRDVPIRDGGAEATLDLHVADAAPPRDVRVSVDIEHTWIGDLVVAVRAPGLPGQIILHQNQGGKTHDLRQTYDASWPGAGALAQLRSVSPAGTWQLVVTDVVEEDVGQIRGFGVELLY